MSQEDPGRTVQTFIDLVQRHEQAFYTFVHNVHSKGQGLFDSLMAWIELFLSYARDGIDQPIDLEFILPHAGENRAQIMAEVDAVAQYHYKLKVAHEEKVRRRFNKAGPTDDEAALLASVMDSLSIGASTMEEAGEINDETSEEEDDDDDDDEYEGHSEQSSRRSSKVEGEDSRRNNVPVPTPEHLDPDLPPLGTVPSSGKKKKERRQSSGTKERSSLEKIRGGFSRHSDSKEKEDKRPPPIRVPPHGTASGEATPRKSASRRAKERAAKADLQPPETPAINELRPLFVEVVSILPTSQWIRLIG